MTPTPDTFRIAIFSAHIYTERDRLEFKKVLPESKYKLDFIDSEITDRDQIIEACKDANGIVTTNTQEFDDHILGNLKQLKIINFNGYWVDTIDLEAAKKYGIVVTHVLDYHIDDLSDHVMTLILASIRKLPMLEKMFRKGVFDSEVRSLNLRSISNLSLGIVGFGKTGQAVAKRALGFGFKNLFAYDPTIDKWLFRHMYVERKDSFEDLLASSDVVTFHVPLTKETYHMMNEATFGQMRKGSVIVNTSRDKVIEEKALIEALHDGTLSFAGMDVFETEPVTIDSPLMKEENAILTPHVAAFSEDSRLYQVRECASRIKELVEGKEIQNKLT